jgi:hypothetical protein
MAQRMSRLETEIDPPFCQVSSVDPIPQPHSAKHSVKCQALTPFRQPLQQEAGSQPAMAQRMSRLETEIDPILSSVKR